MRREWTDRIYLDYAAATPVSDSVRDAMEPYWSDAFANPGALHAEGRAAREVLASARGRIARALGVATTTLTFTSGGTEANNLAIAGVVRAISESSGRGNRPHVIVSEIEHPSVRAVVDSLAHLGSINMSLAPVDGDGIIKLDELKNLLRPETALVSIMYANSEIGTVQPLRKIREIIDQYKREQGEAQPYFHTDASQAPLYLDCRPEHLGADAVTFDAQKCHGPKGVGLLYHASTVPLTPITFGGRQEAGLRPGTENIPLIVGFAEALTGALDQRVEQEDRVRTLRDMGISLLEEELSGVLINGSREHRIANNISVTIPGVDSEYLATMLDLRGIAVGTGSACSAGSGEVSGVLIALADDEQDSRRQYGAIRLTLGTATSEEELRTAVTQIGECVAEMRAM